MRTAIIFTLALALAPSASLACQFAYYRNVNGNCVHRPDVGRRSGATAICRDGDESFSQHHSGTCSGHGGVAQFITKGKPK
jgi:hypothetical protein